MDKVCTKCGLTKPISEFKIDKRTPSGYGSCCKKCAANYSKVYAQNNPKIIAGYSHAYYLKNRDKLKNYKQEYSRTHRESISERERAWRNAHQEELKEYNKKYYKKNKRRIIEKSLQYCKTRRANDPIFRNKCRLRVRIKKLVDSRGGTKSQRTEEIIGCDYNTLWEHLLGTWANNYGKTWNGEAYHIDHILPLSYAITPLEVEMLCHYTNLQMLKPEDNYKKGDKIEWASIKNS